MRYAYVTASGVCLPNAPVANDGIDDVLGRLKSQSAAVKSRVLKINGITSRHYAIDPATGEMTHTNASLTAEAVENACRNAGMPTAEIECLACGTSIPDQIFPGHASMVHAEIGCPPCEVISVSGVCTSGVSALKFGYLSVAAGLRENAVVTGSELVSPNLRASHFEPQIRLNQTDLEDRPTLAFGNEFLRWMLSDGAGALLITPDPSQTGPSLRIDWVDSISFSNESEVCMHLGLRKHGDGAIESYRTVDDEAELFRGGFLALSQDVKVLNDNLATFLKRAGRQVIEKYGLKSEEIDWLLPHYSSHWFRQQFSDGLIEVGLEIPYASWFTNLGSKGNVGAASIYIMLEELMVSGKAEKGQRILCVVPESARMTFSFIHFTVV